MKNLKKAISLLLVMVMAMAMSMTTLAASVDLTNHKYNAYQIFSGKQAEGSAELGQVVWGTGINSGTFLTALKADARFNVVVVVEGTETTVNVFAECTTAAQVAEKLGAYSDGSVQALAFAELAYANKTGTGTAVVNGQTALNAGYYLIVDETVFGENDTDTVYNLALLQLTNEDTFEIATKTDIPSVDKQVRDEVDDAEASAIAGWGESADHAINEPFQFKLTASLPKEINFALYKEYKVEFVDTMSKGITFVSIDSITVDGKIVNLGDFGIVASENAVKGLEGPAIWKITFPNLKAITDVNLTDGANIEVIYTAYLNEDAKVNHQSGDTTNKNGVYLEYSNNPNADGTGKTKEDYVWVFTYDVNNTKYSEEVANANELAGAGFRLYTDEECTEEVVLIWDAGLSAYRPVKTGETGVELFSRSEDANKGKFNIVGLDAGTYYLSETTVPDGYNKCADIMIVIGATHVETNEGASATTTLTTAKNMDNAIVNEKGTVLPETGGMGTTLFYAIGAILVLGSAVVLITKKRMGEN